MEFEFAAVPFDADGDLDAVFKEVPDPESADEDDDGIPNEPRDGVIILNTVGADELSIPGLLGFNIADSEEMDRLTGGWFVDFCGGTASQRYVLLHHRRNVLAYLRAMLPDMPDDDEWRKSLKQRLRCLLDNADICLNQYGQRAAMLVY